MKPSSFVVSGMLALVTVFAHAGLKGVENIYPKVCKEGVHAQPGGQFAVYVFCDDAHGTNIAVMHRHPGDSEFPKWPINQRFWQGGLWAKDVSSIGWVPSRNYLVVSTSEIYGEGAIFLLDLVEQTSNVLLKTDDCGATITAVSNASVTVGLNNCVDEKPFKTVVLKLPKSALEKQPSR